MVAGFKGGYPLPHLYDLPGILVAQDHRGIHFRGAGLAVFDVHVRAAHAADHVLYDHLARVGVGHFHFTQLEAAVSDKVICFHIMLLKSGKGEASASPHL